MTRAIALSSCGRGRIHVLNVVSNVRTATGIKFFDWRLEFVTWEMAIGRLGTIWVSPLSRMHPFATAVLGRHIVGKVYRDSYLQLDSIVFISLFEVSAYRRGCDRSAAQADNDLGNPWRSAWRGRHGRSCDLRCFAYDMQ